MPTTQNETKDINVSNVTENWIDKIERAASREERSRSGFIRYHAEKAAEDVIDT